MRYESKRIIVCGLYLLVWPFGLPSRLAHKWFGNQAMFASSAMLLSLIPGKIGQYIRAAFYKMTLTECHCDLMVGFGSFFAQPTVKAGRGVGMGSFTIVGTSVLGDGVLIGSRVSVLSGKYQHGSFLPGATLPASRTFRSHHDRGRYLDRRRRDRHGVARAALHGERGERGDQAGS